MGKVLGGLLIPLKVTMEMKPSTDRTGLPVVQYLEQFFWADFLEFNHFVTDGSFTADGGLL